MIVHDLCAECVAQVQASGFAPERLTCAMHSFVNL